MMTVKYRLPSTATITIQGQPHHQKVRFEAVKGVGIMPSSIPFIKPKLLVKVGDHVKIGSPLFFDKQMERVQFLSPGGGVVSEIKLGDRRAIERIVITLDSDEQRVSFPSIDKSQLTGLDRTDLVEQLLMRGMWQFFRSFPFRKIPDPRMKPSAIYVSLDDLEPFKPNSAMFLPDQWEQLRLGIQLLNRLSDRVVVIASDQNQQLNAQLKEIVTHVGVGPYPVTDPGVALYSTKKTSDDHQSWMISPQALLQMVNCFQTGTYPIYRMMVVGGPSVRCPQHIDTRVGISLEDLVGCVGVQEQQVRYVVGGVFTGRIGSLDGYLNPDEDAVQVLSESVQSELFTFLKLGFKKPSFSRAFLSSFLFPKTAWPFNVGLNGSARDCISCSHCAAVCPVSLQPQLLLKQLTGDDLDEALRYGLLDCTDCGLCTYVCPSKIELGQLFDNTKKQLHQEMIS